MDARDREIGLIQCFAFFGLIGPLIFWASPIKEGYDYMPLFPLFLLVTSGCLWPGAMFTECPGLLAAAANVFCFAALGLALSQLAWLRRIFRKLYFLFLAAGIALLFWLTVLWDQGNLSFPSFRPRVRRRAPDLPRSFLGHLPFRPADRRIAVSRGLGLSFQSKADRPEGGRRRPNGIALGRRFRPGRGVGRFCWRCPWPRCWCCNRDFRPRFLITCGDWRAAGRGFWGWATSPLRRFPRWRSEALHAYLQVPNFWHPPTLIDALRRWDLPYKLDRVECLWEVAMELAALVRQAFRLPGLSLEATLLFRDKHRMRQPARRGRHPQSPLRQGDHRGRGDGPRPTTWATRWSSSRSPGPARPTPTGSTARPSCCTSCRSTTTSTRWCSKSSWSARSSPSTPSAPAAKSLYYNILRYEPTMLESRTQEWVSPQNMILRDLHSPPLRAAYALGRDVLHGARLRLRLHPHGMVSERKRRGGVRRDRRPAARRHDRRADELQLRFRRLRSLGRSHSRRPHLAADRAQIQRGDDFQAGAGPGPNPRDRRARRHLPAASAATFCATSCCRSARPAATGNKPCCRTVS